MFSFSEKSQNNLKTCHENLIIISTSAIRLSPIDFSIICGFRNQYKQNSAYEDGNSEKRWPYSKHNNMFNNKPYSLAIDFAPYPVDWNDKIGFSLIAGVYFTIANSLQIKIRWGGEWKILKDLGHLELVL